MSTPPRRNDPCPCGSGLRFKECHGRLGEAPATAPRVDAQVAQAVELHRQGRIDEAERIYAQVLERDPGNAIATHYLGMAAWQRGHPAEAERRMRESIERDGGIADFHNNLGLLLRDTGRAPQAVACFERTLAVDPAWNEARSNLGLALESAGRIDEAIEAYRAAIRHEPRFAVAHQNLARALLLRGEPAQAWEEYRWRLAAQGLTTAPPNPLARPLPASLHGRPFCLHGEQGLGDVLFFLRFAPALVARGARLAFRGDARLHPMLARTQLFALGLGEGAAPPGCEDILVGDLPWLTGAGGEGAGPPPLRLAAAPEHRDAARAILEALGPAPLIALTWRAGTASAGPVRTQLKAFEPAALGAALRGIRATWISVQRLPGAGEREALSDALGQPVHDLSACNADLERMLAVMDGIDEYVGVSNANTHLRTGLGKSMKVLVPWPPEWRWGRAPRSPWFPAVDVFRQEADGGWDAAVRALRAALAR